MTKQFSSIVLAAILGLTAGCSQEQSVLVAGIFSQAKLKGKDNAAAGLATSAVVAQQTLYFLASALSQAASIDMQGEDLAPIGVFGRADTTVTYTLNTEEGIGKVSGVRNGKQVIELAFTYEREGGNAGMAYAVTGTAGSVEGFQMFFPRLTFVYTAVLGSHFHPMRDAQGNALFNVSIDAAGSFGIDGVETMRLSKTSLNLTYPLQDGEAKLGRIIATSSNGTQFEGDLWAIKKAIRVKGAIKDASGHTTHELETSDSGETTLRSVAPDVAPPAPTTL